MLAVVECCLLQCKSDGEALGRNHHAILQSLLTLDLCYMASRSNSYPSDVSCWHHPILAKVWHEINRFELMAKKLCMAQRLVSWCNHVKRCRWVIHLGIYLNFSQSIAKNMKDFWSMLKKEERVRL